MGKCGMGVGEIFWFLIDKLWERELLMNQKSIIPTISKYKKNDMISLIF